MDKLLLHVCCATCAAGTIEQLKREYNITCYFYNPNIHPREEYDRRLSDVKKYTKKLNIPLVIGNYDKDKWFELIRGLENEPEGGTLSVPNKHAKRAGQRCLKCYTMRLEQTAEHAQNNRFKSFTSTLTISPHKNAKIINSIGSKIGLSPEAQRAKGEERYGVKYLASDFKKQNGFKCACEIAKREKFYRQSYYGCIYSQN